MPFTPQVQSLTASTPAGLAIHYHDSDPAKAGEPTIVLLHGTGGSAENNFWVLFPMLAMRHRVVASISSTPRKRSHRPRPTSTRCWRSSDKRAQPLPCI